MKNQNFEQTVRFVNQAQTKLGLSQQAENAPKTEYEKEKAKASRTGNWYYFMSAEEKSNHDYNELIDKFYIDSGAFPRDAAIKLSNLDVQEFDNRCKILPIKPRMISNGSYKRKYFFPTDLQAIAAYTTPARIPIPLKPSALVLPEKSYRPIGAKSFLNKRPAQKYVNQAFGNILNKYIGSI